jgi:hypothetical protein
MLGELAIQAEFEPQDSNPFPGAAGRAEGMTGGEGEEEGEAEVRI